MSALEDPLFARAVGWAAGWLAWAAVALAFRLPDRLLLALLAVAERAVRAFAGAGPAQRAVADVRAVIAGGGPQAAAFRRVATASRPGEIAWIVRGAVIRRLS